MLFILKLLTVAQSAIAIELVAEKNFYYNHLLLIQILVMS